MHGPGLGLDDFAGGNALFAFNVVPRRGQASGNVSLEIKFSKALPCAINCVIMTETDGAVYVNESRAVTTSYQ